MFSENKARFVIDFIECLKHTTGKFAGKQFKLFSWQREIIEKLYGTIKDNGLRQYEYLYLEIPKKNGKTALAAALGLYHLFADGEINGEIYGAASERGQASLAFDVAVNMIEQCPALKKRSKYLSSKKRITDKVTGTFYQVLSAEAYSKHGLIPSTVIFDETHALPNRDLWDVLSFGAFDTREQPLLIAISTAGDDPDKLSIGWELHEKAKKIIDGEYNDPRWLCKIYGANDNDDIWDEKVWYKANPSLDLTINIDKVRAAAESAKQNEAEEKLFRWLRLNQWVSLKGVNWIPLNLWDNSIQDNIDLTGMKCYGGLDLSSTTDLTAFTLLFPPQLGLDKWHTLFFAWMPIDGAKQRTRTGIPYDQWIKNKYLMTTPGNAIDYDFVKATIEQLNCKYEIIKIGTDPWNSRMLTQQLMQKSIDVIEVHQSMAGMSPSMKYIEKLIREGNLYHEKNPVARWCFGNVVVAVDGNMNIKPMKNKSKEKIDIIVSMINAMAIAMEYEMESIYEERGLTLL